jgi:hypothetical protein
MSPVSRRFVLTGATLTTASLLVPIAVRASRAADSYEITDWIVIAPSGEVTLALSQPEVDRAGRAAMRVLPVRHDHGGSIASQPAPESERCRHRSGDDQSVSLRDLCPHSRRYLSRRKAAMRQM